MKPKVMIKIYVDIGMTIALMVLMTYELVGQAIHEWLGIGMFILFVMHHILNRKWGGNLLKGHYTPLRIWQTLLVVLVLLCMAGSMVSGIILSRHVLSFLSISGGRSFARSLHMVSAYWGFVWMSLHLGFHWSMMMAMAKKVFLNVPSVCTWTVRILAVAIVFYGAYAFVKRDIADYMFLRIQFVFFDFEEPLFFFLLDYVAAMGLFVFVGHYFAELLKRLTQKRKGHEAKFN